MSNDHHADAGHRPAFLTPEQCKAWLAGAPLTNPPQAQAELLRQLNLLNLQALPAAQRLALLEMLRKPMLMTQHEMVRRFAGRALPLAAPEQAALQGTLALWQSALVGYRHCLLAALEDGSDAVLPLGRALGMLVDSQLDTCRAGYQPLPEHWRALHELYGTAERLGLAERTVEDPLRSGKQAMPLRASYVEALLLQSASPYELPLRQLTWVSNWARRWSVKVTVLAAPPSSLEAKAVPLCVDLGSGDPAGYLPRAGAGARWLDTTGLRASLKKRIALLDGGADPATLQLGSDCVQPAAGRLLKQLYRRWCKGGVARSQDRQPAQGKCEIIAGVEAVHYYVSGRKPFRQPGHVSDDTLRREREEIATFGRLQSRASDGFSEQAGYQAEQWQVVEEWQLHDESAAGVHVSHPAFESRTRIGQGQLAAVRPEGAQSPLLGYLRWTMMDNGGALHAGMLILPGRPEAISVSSAGVESGGDPYRRAFLLPAITSLNTPVTIIIPAGWFKSDRCLEVFTDRARRIRLLELLDRGADFDRATYEDLA